MKHLNVIRGCAVSVENWQQHPYTTHSEYFNCVLKFLTDSNSRNHNTRNNALKSTLHISHLLLLK